MIVRADPDRGRIDLQDVDDLARLSVELTREATLEELRRLEPPLGRFDDTTHALLSIAALRTATGRGHDPEWSRRFDAMVEYAQSRGWVDGDSLRAHIVVDT